MRRHALASSDAMTAVRYRQLLARQLQVSRLFIAEDGDMDDETIGGGALGPADIKDELFDNVNVHYRQPEVSKDIIIQVNQAEELSDRLEYPLQCDFS